MATGYSRAAELKQQQANNATSGTLTEGTGPPPPVKVSSDKERLGKLLKDIEPRAGDKLRLTISKPFKNRKYDAVLLRLDFVISAKDNYGEFEDAIIQETREAMTVIEPDKR